MGLFKLVGGWIGSKKAKKASKKAAKAQIAAMEKGIGEQRAGLSTINSYFDPWRLGGEKAYTQYGNLVGLGGAEAQQAAIDQLQQSPFYQSLYRRGEEAVLQNASATGGIRGGNTVGALADFGADTLATTIDRQLGYLGGLSSMGYGAAGQQAGYTAGTTNNITDLLTGQGQAKAEDYMRRGAITANMWQSGGAFLDDTASQIAGAMMGMPMGGGGGQYGGIPQGTWGLGGGGYGGTGGYGTPPFYPGPSGGYDLGGYGGGGNYPAATYSSGISVTGLPNAMPAGWGGI